MLGRNEFLLKVELVRMRIERLRTRWDVPTTSDAWREARLDEIRAEILRLDALLDAHDRSRADG